MTKQSFRKSLWVLTSSFLLALLLLPTSSFAQRGTKNTKSRAQATTRTTAKKDFNNRRASSATQTTATRRTTARTTTQPTRRTVATKPTSRRTATDATASRSNRTTVNRRNTRRDNDVVTRGTATNRASSSTATTRRPASRGDVNRTVTSTNTNRQRGGANYVYNPNTRNDYCNNYYQNQNNWNRSFWTSINYGYTPSYYNTRYNSFPSVNNLRAERHRYFGERFWLYDGIWFKKRFGRYYAVDAPIGLRLDAIPTGGDLIWYRGDKFVIYRGTTYQMLPFGGFEIVRSIDRF